MIKVPPHVSKDVLTKCLKIADLKYNQQEPEFVLPPAFNAQTFTNVNPSKDVIKLFHYWNSVRIFNFRDIFTLKVSFRPCFLTIINVSRIFFGFCLSLSRPFSIVF